MKKVLIFFLVLALNSCGQPKSTGSNSPLLILGSPIKATETLKTDELNLGVEVCNAFKYKRINYPSLYVNKIFKFNVVEMACNQSVSKSNFISTQIVADQFVSNYTGNYFKNLETDVVGILAGFCGTLNNGIAPSNTEVVALNSVRQFAFSKTDDTHIQVTVTYATRVNEQSNYYSTKFDQMIVQYQTTAQAAWRGLVTFRKTVENCPKDSARTFAILESEFSP